MKRFIIILGLCTLYFSNIAQISIDNELAAKLDGKTKFQEIKSTVWTHLNDKLQKLDTKDSLGRKAVLREKKMWNRQFWINEYYTDGDGKVVDANKLNIKG